MRRRRGDLSGVDGPATVRNGTVGAWRAVPLLVQGVPGSLPPAMTLGAAERCALSDDCDLTRTVILREGVDVFPRRRS